MAMAFHKGRRNVIAVANSPTWGVPSELWEWDGTSWSLITSGGSPAPGSFKFDNVICDASVDKLIFQGAFTSTGIVGHTWEWDAAAGWRQVASAGLAGNRVLVYDEARGVQVLLRGGGGASPSSCHERRGSGMWVQSLTPPNALIGAAVYDPIRRRVLVQASRSVVSTLEEYVPTYPTSLTTFAPGCPGGMGIPSIALTAPWTGAWIGDSLGVTVAGLPMSTALLLHGFSNAHHHGTPLPIDLGAFGMPGCSLRVAVDGYRLATSLGSECQFSMPVPNTQALRGLPFFLQAVVPAPGANAAGVVMSDAIRGVIGSR